MELENILCEIGISSYISYREIYGGKDSKVYRIDVKPGITYALRLLPIQKHHQFIQEKIMLEIAKDNGVPVPKVYEIKTYGNYSVMLMEWGNGQTIFQEMKERPENANRLGYEFGNVQAFINSISVSSYDKKTISWLSPSMEEMEILNKIPQNSLKNNLVHLDYHPLNVLTDGKKITAVIDWANATIGDYRYDISRTLSILRLEGIKHFQKNAQVIVDFERGWRKGYEEVVGSLESLESYYLFNAWSGLRMRRDLAGKLFENDIEKIEEWATNWLNIHYEKTKSK